MNAKYVISRNRDALEEYSTTLFDITLSIERQKSQEQITPFIVP